MKRKTITIIGFALLCVMSIASCQLLLSSEERKLVGKWHERIQQTEDFVTFFVEGWDEYTDDKKMTSAGKFTYQLNIGEDGVNFTIYATADVKSSGTWEIVDGDKLISKCDMVEFSDVRVSSASGLVNDSEIPEFKNEMQNVFSEMRDEMLKKDTTEIVLLTDREFKYKDDEGKVYTMTKVK